MNLSECEGQAGECRISSEMWQRDFGKNPSCRRSSDLKQEKNAIAFFDRKILGFFEFATADQQGYSSKGSLWFL